VSPHPYDWSHQVTRRKISKGVGDRRANGHVGGTNGHADVVESNVGVVDAESHGLAAHLHRASSDDSIADFDARSASSAGGRANRDAYAEPAQADPAKSAEAEGKWLRPPGAASRPASSGDAVNNNAELGSRRESNGGGSSGGAGLRTSRGEKAESAFSLTPPGNEPLPLDGATFVEAVHERVDLIALEEQLLRSADEKIVQRELAYLRELRYGKTASFATDDEMPPRIVFDPPDSNS
jgi:hypothetical protein